MVSSFTLEVKETFTAKHSQETRNLKQASNIFIEFIVQ